ncbi:hypothetical protein AVEN_31587-1 [Araneus ventricosus]|uniref:THAP-type domain-containing protein n=1 Tax=Araneus ventricosus TaxID=182803 RepID=A0A4Y2UF38_ARAVE|nr:hypothetical protein AVEN_178165-1 [Araneus ventricosus]GBO10206.1 hypothetical protein AVEN_31587-1 [Araneus ventricosus]
MCRGTSFDVTTEWGPRASTGDSFILLFVLCCPVLLVILLKYCENLVSLASMSACAVATCPNYHRKTKGKGVIYHMFPVCPNLNKIWISKCKRKDRINVKYARICSDHFRPSDYMDDMKNRLLGLNQKKILKPDAVPSVNLPLKDNGEDVSSRSERKRKRSILQEAKIRLKCLSPKKACETSATEPFTTPTTKNICSSCFETQKENALLLERIRFIENKLEKTTEEIKKNQRKKIKEMKAKAQIGRILTENKRLKSEVKKLSKIEENFKILKDIYQNPVPEQKFSKGHTKVRKKNEQVVEIQQLKNCLGLNTLPMVSVSHISYA